MSLELFIIFVADLLATSVILRCDFCKRHVKAIDTHFAIIYMDDCSTVHNPLNTILTYQYQRNNLYDRE